MGPIRWHAEGSATAFFPSGPTKSGRSSKCSGGPTVILLDQLEILVSMKVLCVYSFHQ